MSDKTVETLSEKAKRLGTAEWDGCRAAAEIMCDNQEALKRMVVYQITLANGKRYIGSTKRPLVARLAEHLSIVFHPHRGRGRQSMIYPAIRKHGWAKMVVEVLWQCSKPTELIKVEGDFITISEPEYNIRVPFCLPGMNSRYDAEAKKKMLEMYKAGEKFEAIAGHFGCHPSTLGDCLGELGVTKKERFDRRVMMRKGATKDQEEAVLALLRVGMTASQAAVCVGITYPSAKNIAQRVGISTKIAANQNMRVVFDVDAAVRLWRSGLSLSEVGYELGVSTTTVGRYIRKHGVSKEELFKRKGVRI